MKKRKPSPEQKTPPPNENPLRSSFNFGPFPQAETQTPPVQLKNQHLIGNKSSGPGKSNILYQLFKPLIDNDRISREDLSTLADKYGNFYSKDPRDFLNHKIEFINTSKDRQNAFLLDKTRALPSLKPRATLAQELGKFTIEALGKSDLSKVILDPRLKSAGREARGIYSTKYSNLILNPDVSQDLLSTIVHEGNHALESFNPFVKSTVENFLKQKIQKSGRLQAGYIPQLYKDIQAIINLPKREFASLYSADQPSQRAEISEETLANPFHGLASNFDEIPPFALESLMQPNHSWVNDEQTNPDSRKLLRRLMKDTHQLYSNKGLVDKSTSLGAENTGSNFLPYKYNKQDIHRYPYHVEAAGHHKEGRSKYKELNDAFIERIQFLKKFTPSQSSSSSLNLQPSSSSSSSSSPYSGSSSSSPSSFSSSSSPYSNSSSSQSSSLSSSPSGFYEVSSSLPPPSSSPSPGFSPGGRVTGKNLLSRFKKHTRH